MGYIERSCWKKEEGKQKEKDRPGQFLVAEEEAHDCMEGKVCSDSTLDCCKYSREQQKSVLLFLFCFEVGFLESGLALNTLRSW